MDSKAIAEIAYYANNVYRKSIGEQYKTPWRYLSSQEIATLINAVNRVIESDIPYSPEVNHMAWLTEKIQQGWIYGEKEDVERRIHPCLKPYHKLSNEMKAKDMIFVAIVHGLKDI